MISSIRNWKPIVLAGAVFFGTAYAGQAWSFERLAEAYYSALRSDRLFRGAEAQHRAVLEKLPQARAGLLPTVSASANRSANDVQVNYDSQFADTDRQFRINGWTVSLNQPLFRMVNYLQYGRAQLQIEQSSVQLEMARYDLTVRLANAFLDWQAALRTKDVTESARRYMETVAARARSQRKEQMLTVPDLLDAEAHFRKAEADATEAAQILQVKAAALAKVAGELPPAKLFSFAGLPWPEVKGAMNVWVDQARDRNPQVRYQTLQIAIAEKDVSSARAGHLPTLNLVANQNRTFNSGSASLIEGAVASTQKLFSVGVQLEIPIYSGGLVNSRTAEAIAVRDKAREDMENAIIQAGIDAQTYYLKAQVGAVQVDAAEKRIQAAESQLAAARSGLTLRTSLEVDVLSAESALLGARRDLFKAQADRMVAVLQLRQAAGELTNEDIEVWSKLLVPAAQQATAK